MIRTDDEEYVEAIVERRTDDHPSDTKGPKAVAEGRRDGGEESYRVTGHQCWDSAVVIGYVAENQAADDAADEEGRLSRGTEESLVANPFELTKGIRYYNREEILAINNTVFTLISFIYQRLSRWIYAANTKVIFLNNILS